MLGLLLFRMDTEDVLFPTNTHCFVKHDQNEFCGKGYCAQNTGSCSAGLPLIFLGVNKDIAKKWDLNDSIIKTASSTLHKQFCIFVKVTQIKIVKV